MTDASPEHSPKPPGPHAAPAASDPAPNAPTAAPRALGRWLATVGGLIVVVAGLALLIVQSWRLAERPAALDASNRPIADGSGAAPPDAAPDAGASEATNNSASGEDSIPATPPAADSSTAKSPADATGGPPSPDAPASEKPPAATAGEPEVAQRPGTPAVPVERLPWHDLVASGAESATFADVCFDGFDFTKSLPTRDALQQWFEPVVGHGLRWSETRTDFGPCATLEGVVRLRAPLGDELALRLSLDHYPRLQLHFWSGRRGITLMHFADEQYRWLAFATTRAEEQALPTTWSLVASDAGRSRRTAIRPSAPLEIRHRDGRIILSRGDVTLLQAPLPEKLTDVFVSGKATYQGIALVRTQDGPALLRDWPEFSAVQRDQAVAYRPADWDWQGKLPAEAKLEKQSDGGVCLTGNKPPRLAVTAPLPGTGPREILLEIAHASPGSGVFLARAGQPPGKYLRFLANRRQGGLELAWCNEDDRWESTPPVIHERGNNASNDSCWLRLIAGCGVIRVWKSDDGQQWVELQPPAKMPTDGLTHLGIQQASGPKGDTAITLKSVVVRPLQAIEHLAHAELLARVPDLTPAKDPNAWQMLVAKSRPAEISELEWNTACAVRSFMLGREATLETVLVERLLEAISAEAAREGDLAKPLAQLTELGALVDLLDNNAALQAYAKHWQTLGLKAFLQRDVRPYSQLRWPYLTMAVESRHIAPPFDPLAIRCELLQLLYASRWADVIQLIRTVRYFQQHDAVALLPWADAMARRMTPGRDAPATVGNTSRERKGGRGGRGPGAPPTGPRSGVRLAANWSHPLQEDLSKEAYNAFAELEALVESEAYDDAARLIAGLQPDAVPGLAPLRADDELLASLPTAVPWFLANSPALAEARERRFREIAPLRVRQALQSGEPAAVQLAARQFVGTEAAAEAEQWLGDRALVTGLFAAARSAYLRAVRTVSDDQRPALEARQRIAAALLGQDPGPSPVSLTRPISIGDATLSSTDLDALIGQLRQRTSDRSALDNDANRLRALPEAMRPGPVDAPVRAALDGLVGEQPNDEVTRNLTRFKVDWPAKQLGTTLAGNLLIVNNRFHLAAYDLGAGGQRRWQSVLPEGKRLQRARDWTLVAMTPRVAGNVVFARQLLHDGPLLGCWNLSDGKLVWLADGLKSLPIASDPWLIQDRLQTLTMARLDNQESVLRLATFDPESGELVSQVDLARLTAVWHVRHMCETALVDDTLVVVLGGVVLACDLNGQLRWIRKQVVLPPEEEPDWVLQPLQKPLVRDGKLYVTQPGVRTIDCIDVVTGALLWRRFHPEIRQTLALDGDRLLIATDQGLESLSATTGKTQWTHSAPSLLAVCQAGGPYGAVYARTKPIDGKKQRVELVWVHGERGTIEATSELPSLDDAEPRIGPFISNAGKNWTFFGRGLQEPKRELLELSPR